MRRRAGIAMGIVLLCLSAGGAAASQTTGSSRESVDAARRIGMSVTNLGLSGTTDKYNNAFVCHASANGHVALTTRIRYCRVITSTGASVSALPVTGIKYAFTAGAGRRNGFPGRACMGVTATYLGGVTLTRDECFPLEPVT